MSPRTRHTTVSADADDLNVLAREAKRRKVSLSKILSEAVADKAAETRRRLRPRAGLFASGPEGIRAGMEAEEDALAATPFR